MKIFVINIFYIYRFKNDKPSKSKYVLGVETSCDDTAIGIIDSSKNIKANIVLNQNNYHKEFGGIVPEIAARAHLSFIDIALKKL